MPAVESRSNESDDVSPNCDRFPKPGGAKGGRPAEEKEGADPRHIVGSSVLILQVVGMLPHVKASNSAEFLGSSN